MKLSALVLAALVLAGGCTLGTPLGGATTVLSTGETEWAVVVYMSADNDLEAQAIEDVNEMEAAGLAGTGVTVIALVDRGPGYDSSNGDWTGTRAYQITDDPDGVDGEIASIPLSIPGLGIDPSEADVELNMGDPATLAGLLGFVEQAYQPQHTALVIWGHGSGYRSRSLSREQRVSDYARATSFDDSSGGDALFTAELRAALTGTDVDLIGFDTCFGANLETAYELRDTARFMVASQDLIPADGWEYDDLLARVVSSDRTPSGFAEAIVGSFANSAAGYAPGTIAAIDLSRIAGVHTALNAFSIALHDGILNDAERTAVRDALFYDVEDFYATPGDLAIDLRDLASVVSDQFNLADGQASELDSALSAALIDQWTATANPRATGLSVHLIPLEADGNAAVTHDEGYFRGSSAAHPLQFVAGSDWVPALPDGPGLLHRLFYEVM